MRWGDHYDKGGDDRRRKKTSSVSFIDLMKNLLQKK